MSEVISRYTFTFWAKFLCCGMLWQKTAFTLPLRALRSSWYNALDAAGIWAYIWRVEDRHLSPVVTQERIETIK